MIAAPAAPRPKSTIASTLHSTPVYQPSPTVPSPAASSSNTPVHASPPPIASSTSQPNTLTSTNSVYYQPPRNPAYQYGPGSWSYHYTPPLSSAHPAYLPLSGQPSSSVQPVYGQPPLPPPVGYNPYPYLNPGAPYPQYPHYSGYNGYAPPPPPPPGQYQPQPPPEPSQQQKGLQWQRPYTGPKEPVPRPPPLTVPTIPTYYGTPYVPALPTPASASAPTPPMETRADSQEVTRPPSTSASS